MWRKMEEFSESFSEVSLAFEWWRDLLSIPRSSDCLCEYVDFWEELNKGWMSEYVWPYDDWFKPDPSPERKLRLGMR